VHTAVVGIDEARLMSGTLPVLDENLCRDADSKAIAPQGSSIALFIQPTG
jgi:hypothetical protein